MKGDNALTASAVSVRGLTSLYFLKGFPGLKAIATKTATDLYENTVTLVGATTALGTAGQNFLGGGDPAISRAIESIVLGFLDLGVLIAVSEAGILEIINISLNSAIFKLPVFTIQDKKFKQQFNLTHSYECLDVDLFVQDRNPQVPAGGTPRDPYAISRNRK